MGKKEHLAKMLGLPRIAKEWEQRHGVALRLALVMSAHSCT